MHRNANEMSYKSFLNVFFYRRVLHTSAFYSELKMIEHSFGVLFRVCRTRKQNYGKLDSVHKLKQRLVKGKCYSRTSCSFLSSPLAYRNHSRLLLFVIRNIHPIFLRTNEQTNEETLRLLFRCTHILTFSHSVCLSLY